MLHINILYAKNKSHHLFEPNELSDLSAEIYDDNEGLNIVNIDYSDVCIQKMAEKNIERKNMQCKQNDRDHIYFSLTCP